jgi:hypothetical protein
MLRVLVFVAALLAVSVSGVHAQTRFGVSESDYALAVRWLHTNCLAPDARPLVEALIGRRAAMQKAFAGALAEGPTEEEIATVRRAAADRWRLQRRFIDNPALKDALPADQSQALRKQTEDEAIRSEVDSFVNGYRSNAMAGLAIVGDDDAIRKLREMAGRGSSPEALAARGALVFRESLKTR